MPIRGNTTCKTGCGKINGCYSVIVKSRQLSLTENERNMKNEAVLETPRNRNRNRSES
jgi:hypothetical protein